MINKSITTFYFKEYELLYFNGENYQPSNTFFHHNIWMYLTFLIQGIGVLMNSYLVRIWFIVLTYWRLSIIPHDIFQIKVIAICILDLVNKHKTWNGSHNQLSSHCRMYVQNIFVSCCWTDQNSISIFGMVTILSFKHCNDHWRSYQWFWKSGSSPNRSPFR